MSYRVVYGETIPAWEKTFPTKRQAEAFARKHESFGDVIFSIRKIDLNQRGPFSLTSAIATDQAIADRIDGYDRDDLGESPDF